MADLDSEFAAAAGALAQSGEAYGVQLITQLSSLDYEVTGLVDELRRRRAGEVSRGLSLFGPHRDDLRFLEIGETPVVPAAVSKDESESMDACAPLELPSGGRDLKLFGSQGEQRLAVLALLIAEQEIAARRTGEPGILFLDDVMSELDDARRRLLVTRLSKVGQVIVTTTNRHYFTESELERATVISLPLGGSVPDSRGSPGALEHLGEGGQQE
jgi:DNA replication and repair protein RecF